MTIHTIEYSRSSRAKCHGPAPCKGSKIDAGVIRYGRTYNNDYGETVQWRHWGCVTPQILGQLAVIGLEHIAEFHTLSPEDKQKVRTAINTRRIDPADVPPTAQPPIMGQQPPIPAPSSSQMEPRKRKLHETVHSSSTPSTSHVATASAEEAEDESSDDTVDELFCSLSTSVVGIQYYTGLVGAGEEVRLVREPNNHYDRNAIQVKNIGNRQVGHIPRNVAARLAPLLDQNLITAEGIMRQGNLTGGRGYTLAMTLNMYGPSSRRDILEPMLIWATPGQRGFGGSSSRAGSQAQGKKNLTKAQQEAARKQFENAAELRSILDNLERVDDESRRSSLLDTLCPTEDVLDLPLHPNPPGIDSGDLLVDLLKHQSQALQWCIEREYPVLPQQESDRPAQFWQLKKGNKKTYFYNIVTKTPQEAPPHLGKGGLFADSMGLGKTLTTLALVVATKKDIPVGFSKTSLIVVPLSVISNWEQQIQEHCTPGTISFCIYHGLTKSISTQELEAFDVVITTYQTVVAECQFDDASRGKKKKQRLNNTLFQMNWKRIVLDEGHCIRNPKTKMAQAVCTLNADRRWVLSGTPIINSPRDLGSLLTFLRICHPLDNEDFFKRLLLRPLKDGTAEGVNLLRVLMSNICIRRTKEMQDKNGNCIVPLPPVEMTIVPIALHPEARALYDSIEAICKERVESIMITNGGINPVVQANVLSMLTRLRQLALHPGLIPTNYLEHLHASEKEGPVAAIRITPEDKTRLQGLLAQAIEDNEECPVCFCILIDPRITTCAHPFCLACITEVISRDPRCPMDRRPLRMEDLVEPAPPTELTQTFPSVDEIEEADGIRAGSSAKIDQLIHLLKLTPTTEKSLVFSQFTSFLDKIAEILEEHGIPFARFDGKMSAKRRQEALKRFEQPVQDVFDLPLEETRSLRPRQIASNVYGDNFSGDDDDDEFVEGQHEHATPTKRSKGKTKSKQDASQNPKVMLLSLKTGAFGLNLTVANNIYLMDPWWQEGIESQAIDRCNRIGQKKTVHVYQMIAENTVESKVLVIQERKKKLVQQAFSGFKGKENPREKKEARLQDLVEVFGVRQQAAS